MAFLSTLNSRLFTLVFLVWFGAMVGSTAHAQRDFPDREFQVGDLVEFDFLGTKTQGQITKFTGTGWPYVEFDHRGKTTERFFPGSRLTLVKAVDDMGDAGNELMGKSAMRTWTDATGAFEIKAKLISNKNGKVELEKEDGRVVTLPAINLSDEDQAYLKDLEKAAAAEKDENNPFAGGVMKDPKKAAANRGNRANRRTPASDPTQPAIEPEYDSNGIVLSNNGWHVEPDGAATVPATNKVINFSTGLTKHKFHNKMSPPSLSADKKTIAVSISNVFDSTSEIVTIDLENEKSNLPLSIAGKETKLMAISPNGKMAVTLRGSRGRDPGKLEFWNLSEKEATLSTTWNTAGFHNRNGFAPKSGLFIDESRLLTLGRRVILWDVETAAALYSFAISESTSPALSPNAKQVAVVSGKSIYLVGTADGAMLGMLEGPGQAIQKLAFSQSGQFLAGLAELSGEIYVWDLSNQELVREFAAPGGSARSIQWVGDQYVLVNDSILMDVELRAAIWNYQTSGGNLLNTQDGRFWFAGNSKLTPVKLPHKNFDAQTAGFDPDKLLVLKPGAEVTIELDLPFQPAQQKTIRDKLVQMLEANDVVVRDNAELKVVASVKKGKQQSMEVSGFTDPLGMRGTEKITYTPNTMSLYLIKDDVKLWSKTRQYGPGGFITRTRGETTQQAATRMCQPNPNFFTTIKLPKYIGQLHSGKPVGVSRITEQGIQ